MFHKIRKKATLITFYVNHKMDSVRKAQNVRVYLFQKHALVCSCDLNGVSGKEFTSTLRH